jgi:hypothetical protein
MIDYLGVQQRVEKFDIEHGLNAVMYGEGWLLFPDAAIRETNPLGALKEPPEDPFKRARLIVEYWIIKQNLAVREFTTYKRFLLSQADAVLRDGQSPLPEQAEAIKQLKDLKAKVSACQSKLDAARADVETNKPAGLRQREIAMQEYREQAASLLTSLKEIEI